MATPTYDPVTETFSTHAFVPQDATYERCDACGSGPKVAWHTNRLALLVSYAQAHRAARCPTCNNIYVINKDGFMWCSNTFTHSNGPAGLILNTEAV